MNSDKTLLRYKEFLERNGNSENVVLMYCKRVRTFLSFHPESLIADKTDLRRIVDDYVDGLPMNSGLGVTATAVRYFWSSVYGPQYFKRTQLKDFSTNLGIENEAALFEEYLRSQGRLSENTIMPRVRMVKLFLYCQYGGDEFSRDLVRADDVRRHISETMSYTTASTKSGFSSNIRSYAKFLESKGYNSNMKAILRLPLRGPALKSSLPKCISDEDYSTLLEMSEKDSERGTRDRAILLLMGNLGLRNCDVVRLTLDDIDWKNAIIHVHDSKSITNRTIPLDSETGLAIETYVMDSRSFKEAKTRALFLPAGNETPGTAMTYNQMRERIQHLAEKAGLANYCGTHSLRRAAASNMTNNGVSVKAIADILGHESITTTMGYLKVNIANLKQACSLWPEGGML